MRRSSKLSRRGSSATFCMRLFFCWQRVSNAFSLYVFILVCSSVWVCVYLVCRNLCSSCCWQDNEPQSRRADGKLRNVTMAVYEQWQKAPFHNGRCSSRITRSRCAHSSCCTIVLGVGYALALYSCFCFLAHRLFCESCSM